MSTAEEKAAAKADKNIAGQRFGRMTAVEPLEGPKYLYCLLLEPDERAYQKLRMFKKP